MNVFIKSFAMIREIIGHREISLEVKSNASVFDVLTELISNYPDLKSYILENGAFRKNFKLVLNSEELIDQNTKVKNNDKLVIIPPTGGG